jgi:hypothetical protein
VIGYVASSARSVAGAAISPSQLGNLRFSRSTVWRHLGVVGLQTVFWLPNRPIYWTA